MMFIDSENKVLKTQSELFLSQNERRFVVTSDYNNIVQKLDRIPESNKLFFSFSAYHFEEIFKISGKYFIEKYYQDFTLEEKPENGFDITISYDCSNLLAPQKPSKQSTPEEVQQIKDSNAAQRVKNQEISARVSSQIASFKRNFYAACFEDSLERINKGDVPSPFKFSTRENETVWVIPDKEAFNVFFGVSFDDNVDSIIGKLILDEMVEAKRHVKNAPQVGKQFGTDEFPKILTEAFPELKTTKPTIKNGLVNISNLSISVIIFYKALFQQQHFTKNIEGIATLLQGFRQYLHYHIHSSKTYLHSRVVRRLNLFLKQLNGGLFEKEEGQVYRTNREENRVVQEEEEKKSQVFRSQVA